MPAAARARRDVCRKIEPQLTEYADGHLAACHHPQNVTADEVAAATRSPLSPLSSGEQAPSFLTQTV